MHQELDGPFAAMQLAPNVRQLSLRSIMQIDRLSGTGTQCPTGGRSALSISTKAGGHWARVASQRRGRQAPDASGSSSLERLFVFARHASQPRKGQPSMTIPEFMHLNDVKTVKDDFHADLWIRRVQINERQIVSFRGPDGVDSQLKLKSPVREGTVLSLAGKGVGGRGHLRLHVRLIDF